MRILFIQTGGTIDKDYPRKKNGYAFEIGVAAVHRILSNIVFNFSEDVLSVLQKDSSDITDSDRSKLLEFVASRKEDKIIITHGTDTMIKTAEILNVIVDKTIVITGAMRPEKFSDSDAPFNVGFAVAAVQILNPGVYIAMNGRVYNWDRCIRDDDGSFSDRYSDSYMKEFS